MSAGITVALIQHAAGGSAAQAWARIEEGLREARAQGADLAVLQELHNGPYFCQWENAAEFARAEPIPGPSTERLGVLVCWDQWYPEAARLMTLAGADMLVYPTAIGFDPRDDDAEKARQKEAWELIQRAHAVANGIPVLAVNRCGHEPDPSEATPGITFWGGSFVCGAQGEWLARAGDTPGVLIARIATSRTEQTRQIWPFLRDRRIEAYADLQKRYRD